MGRLLAVENDYNLLVQNLNELEKTISSLRDQVQSRRLREAEEHREPNETDWVNLISLQLQSVDHIFNGLQTAVKEVLGSKRRRRLQRGTAGVSRVSCGVNAQPATFLRRAVRGAA